VGWGEDWGVDGEELFRRRGQARCGAVLAVTLRIRSGIGGHGAGCRLSGEAMTGFERGMARAHWLSFRKD